MGKGWRLPDLHYAFTRDAACNFSDCEVANLINVSLLHFLVLLCDADLTALTLLRVASRDKWRHFNRKYDVITIAPYPVMLIVCALYLMRLYFAIARSKFILNRTRNHGILKIRSFVYVSCGYWLHWDSVGLHVVIKTRYLFALFLLASCTTVRTSILWVIHKFSNYHVIHTNNADRTSILMYMVS